jgi:sugar O-acyltransferase (sialic acid O-acetyltransferase NeuD family)
MLIVGAKGFAKEVLEICHQNNNLENLVFYDDVNDDVNGLLYGKFPILKSLEEAKDHFEKIDARFTIGIGNPLVRKMLYTKFVELGGLFTSTISSSCYIGNYNNSIREGVNIMQKVVITNDVHISKGCLVNQLSSIGHDVVIGEFTEICPSVSISGNCNIGSNVFVGTNATILPNVIIGNNTIIGAGAVVNKNLPENCVAVGIPAKIIKINE